MHTGLKETQARLKEAEQQRERLLTETLTAKKDNERLAQQATEQAQRVGELEEQLANIHLVSNSKDETLANLAASRYQMHAQLEGREMELSSTKQEAARYSTDLRETLSQLQVAQNRVKTLEKHVRHLDEMLGDLQELQPKLLMKDTEIESLRMQLMAQEVQERHATQLSELLAEKEMMLAESLKKNSELLEVCAHCLHAGGTCYFELMICTSIQFDAPFLSLYLCEHTCPH
jgi:hypothetical protein